MTAIRTLIALILTLFCALKPSPVAAGQDWVQIRSTRVADPGHFQASFGLAHSVQESWALGDNGVLLADNNGTIESTRRVDVAFALGWQMNRAWGLKLALPYELMERSPLPPDGSAPIYRLTDPGLLRQDGFGDASLELRRAWGTDAGEPGALASLWLSLKGPSGQGPFESQHPLVATGEGRWQVQPGFTVGHSLGVCSLTLQVGMPVQLGREATVSSLAPVGYGLDGPHYTPGGNVWLGPRYGAETSLGLAWDWHVDEDSRQTLALECYGSQRSPLDMGGALIPDTAQVWIGFIPELQAHFGRFHALAAWILRGNYADNMAYADFGESHLRVDYGF